MTSTKLRYLGVNALAGRREYEFLAEEQENRHFTLVVQDLDFSSNHVSFQEAPDLCYQKLQAELKVASETPIGTPILVSPEDLARYRETHQRAKTSRGGWSRQR